MDRAKQLIGIARDESATISERDDAAMDLAAFDGLEVETALIEIAKTDSSDTVRASAGESLGEIYCRRLAKMASNIASLPEADARAEAIGMIRRSVLFKEVCAK